MNMEISIATIRKSTGRIGIDIARHLARAAHTLLGVLTYSIADAVFLPKRSICIALEDSGAAVAFGSRFLRRVRIIDWKKRNSTEIGGLPPESLASFAAAAVSGFKAFGAEFTLSIPESWTLRRTAEFPVSVCENLPGVIAGEMDRLTPFHPNQVFYDYSVLEGPPGRIRIMLTAVRSDRIAPYLEAFRKKGIAVTRLFPGFSTGRLPSKGKITDPPIPFPIGPAGLKPGALQKKSFSNIRVRLPESGENPPYPAVIGVVKALQPEKSDLNLLRKGDRKKDKMPFGATAALCLAVLALAMLTSFTPLQTEGERLRQIDRQISQRKEDVRRIEALKREAERLRGEIALINRFKERRPPPLSIVKELTAILPKTVWLSRMRLTESSLEMEGYASGSAAEIMPKLEASALFKKAEFAAPTFRDARMNTERFVIRMELKGAEPPAPRRK